MTQTPLHSLSESPRLMHLDVLRGFALLGILLANFQWFSQSMQAMWFWPNTDTTGLDRVADVLVIVLVEGKFYPLFALLFGAGFAVMADRARHSGRSGGALQLRRLLVLGLLGVAHILLVWSGDILLVYAVTGMVMLVLFRNTPQQRQWKWALAGLAIPLLMILLLWMGMAADPEFAREINADLQEEDARISANIEWANAVFSGGNFVEALRARVSDYLFFVDTQMAIWLSSVFGYFMLGRWLIASGRLARPSDFPGFFRGWSVYGLLVGLVLTVISVWILFQESGTELTTRALLGYLLLGVAATPLSLAYLAWVMGFADRLHWLAPAGRLALSNYLLQSLFWTSVFYGYGLGLWGQIPMAWYPVLAVGFFAMQVQLSRWWLSHFYFGPAEWLWRSLTYWRRQPFVRRDGSTL